MTFQVWSFGTEGRSRSARRSRVGSSLSAGCLAAVLTLWGAMLWAQETADPPKAPTLADGRALLQAGESEKAVAVLEAVTQADPTSAPAWLTLGRARAAAQQDAPAVTAFLKAAGLSSSPRRRQAAVFGAAQAQARLGRTEEALFLLQGLRDGNAFNLTNIDADPSFAGLLEDDRFRALQPTAEALAHPFVGEVKVIHHWAGEAAGDNFGWIARSLGDVDGDGLSDVVTSAPQKNLGGATAGRIYAYSSKSGGLLWSSDGAPGDVLGRGVEAAGDVNADGIPDAVASAPGGDHVLVFSGKDGKTLLKIEASQPGEAIGQHVKGIGDLNGDGHGDVLVGAPQFDPPPAEGQEPVADAGRAAVYSGADGKILWQFVGDRPGQRLGETVSGGFDGRRIVLMVGAPGVGEALVFHGDSSTPWRVLEGELSRGSFGGMFMSVVGDVDADGIKDLYVSDWQDNVRGPARGRIYVYSGADGSRLLTVSGEAPGDGFGIGSAEAGDLDGDGHDDLVIGAWQHAAEAPGAGKVYVISGQNGAELRTLVANVAGETFGFDAQGIGDVNGDGKIDLLLTSAWSRVTGARSGRVFIIAGQ